MASLICFSVSFFRRAHKRKNILRGWLWISNKSIYLIGKCILILNNCIHWVDHLNNHDAVCKNKSDWEETTNYNNYKKTWKITISLNSLAIWIWNGNQKAHIKLVCSRWTKGYFCWLMFHLTAIKKHWYCACCTGLGYYKLWTCMFLSYFVTTYISRSQLWKF